MSKRKYHKSNCDATVRAIVEDALGRKVILVGKHAFEWSIILEKEGKLVITTFPNREKAVDTFNNKYRRKWKALNYILFGILLLVLLFYVVMTISQPRYAVINILLYIIPTLIGIYFGVKVIKHE